MNIFEMIPPKPFPCLEVGKFYATRSKQIVQITHEDPHGGVWRFSGFVQGEKQRHMFTSQGGFGTGYKTTNDPKNVWFTEDLDLMEEVSKETHPEYFL